MGAVEPSGCMGLSTFGPVSLHVWLSSFYPVVARCTGMMWARRRLALGALVGSPLLYVGGVYVQ